MRTEDGLVGGRFGTRAKVGKWISLCRVHKVPRLIENINNNNNEKN